MGRSYSLPDISARYNLYSAGLLSSLNSSSRDWDLISFNTHSLNTLLTSKYTIPVSDELYKKETFIQQSRPCLHCFQKEYRTVTDDEGNQTKEYFETQTKIPCNEIELYEERIGEIELILMSFGTENVVKTTRKYWVCPKCNNENLASKTPASDRRFGSGSTFGVMYEIPKRTMVNRSYIDRLRMNWVTDFMREIDVGLMAYQKAYFDEHGENMQSNVNPFAHEER